MRLLFLFITLTFFGLIFFFKPIETSYAISGTFTVDSIFLSQSSYGTFSNFSSPPNCTKWYLYRTSDNYISHALYTSNGSNWISCDATGFVFSDDYFGPAPGIPTATPDDNYYLILRNEDGSNFWTSNHFDLVNAQYTAPSPTPTPTNTPTPTLTETPTPTPIPTYEITGTVYIDNNENGFQDAGEANYEGAELILSGDSSANDTTDTNGSYSFINLFVGSYTVTLTIPSGYTTTTSNPVNIPLTANTTVNFGIVLAPTNTPTPTPTNTPTPTPPQLTSLSPTNVWIGLKNSDAIGIKFDILTEAYKDGELISSGELDSVSGGSSGFSHAILSTIPFDNFSPIDFPAGSQLSLKILVRNACIGSGKNSGVARLWYDDNQANSRFDATIDGVNNDYFLRDLFVLATFSGPGPKKIMDVQAGAKCSSFKPFGT